MSPFLIRCTLPKNRVMAMNSRVPALCGGWRLSLQVGQDRHLKFLADHKNWLEHRCFSVLLKRAGSEDMTATRLKSSEAAKRQDAGAGSRYRGVLSRDAMGYGILRLTSNGIKLTFSEDFGVWTPLIEDSKPHKLQKR